MAFLEYVVRGHCLVALVEPPLVGTGDHFGGHSVRRQDTYLVSNLVATPTASCAFPADVRRGEATFSIDLSGRWHESFPSRSALFRFDVIL